MGMTETGDRQNRPQTPPDPPVICDWDGCDWEIDPVTDLCQMHELESYREAEAELAIKRTKEDSWD